MDLDAARERKLVAEAKRSVKAMDRLVRSYEGLCVKIARRYRYPGASHDDVVQEARIGVAKAAMSYDLASEVPFFRFAEMCVERSVITGLKTARRGKHGLLNDALRVGRTDEGKEIELVDLIPSPYSIDPFLVLVAKERVALLIQRTRALSELERRSVIGIASGFSYTAISRLHGISTKSIDNAAQRARHKLQAA